VNGKTKKTTAMKKSILMLMVVTYLSLVSFTVFEKKIGSSSCYDEGYSVIQLETGYLVSGSYNCSGGPSAYKSLLLRLNDEGDTIWSRYDTEVSGYAKKTSDNHLIFIGGNTAGLIYDSIRISKTDLEGNVLWSKSFYFSGCKNSVTDIIEVTNGYVIVGFFSATACYNPSYESFIMKLDLNGNHVWTKVFSGTHHEQFHSVKELSKGVLAAFGWSNSFSPDHKADYLLVKYDENGNLMDTRQYGDPDKNNFGYGMEILPDGSFVFTGYSDVMEVMQVNADMTMRWLKTYQATCGSSYFKVKKTSDNGLAIIGTETINDQCISVFYKMKINGDILWKKELIGIVRDFSETPDGMFVLTGFADYLPDMYVVKFDSVRIDVPVYATSANQYRDVDVAAMLQDMGIATSVDEQALETKFPSVKIFPNPAIQSITMQFYNPNHKPFRLEVYDLKGVMVYMRQNITTSEIILFRGNLDKGTYLYKLTGNGNIYSGKIIFN
jgi:hypothetical protein